MRASAPVAAALLLCASCGRPHDLGVGGGSSTVTGSGGSTATSSITGGAGGSTTTTTTSSTTTSTPVDPGPTALTVVNGVADYPAVRFCFLPDDTPWPTPASGLAFARGLRVTPIPTGDVTPWVIAGDLAQTSGKSCAQILALAGADAGSPVVARALGVIPSSVWSSNRSLLLVAQGCLGGDGHDDPSAKSACGPSYTPSTPTAGATLVGMSRVGDAAHVSLQVVNASAGAPDIEVRVLPSITNATEISVVAGLSPGAIGPTPPWAMLTSTEYGPLDTAAIKTYLATSTTAASVIEIGALLSANGLGASDFGNAAELVLVGVGAAPGLPAAKFWRAFTFAIVKADPG